MGKTFRISLWETEFWTSWPHGLIQQGSSYVLFLFIQVSKTAGELKNFIESMAAEDPLLKGVPEDKNPFKEKGGCIISWPRPHTKERSLLLSLDNTTMVRIPLIHIAHQCKISSAGKKNLDSFAGIHSSQRTMELGRSLPRQRKDNVNIRLILCLISNTLENTPQSLKLVNNSSVSETSLKKADFNCQLKIYIQYSIYVVWLGEVMNWGFL